MAASPVRHDFRFTTPRAAFRVAHRFERNRSVSRGRAAQSGEGEQQHARAHDHVSHAVKPFRLHFVELSSRAQQRGGNRENRAEHCQRDDRWFGKKRVHQNRPTTFPSMRSIFKAAGSFGNPGIVMTSPQIITTNSAPAASRTSRTLTTCPEGAPRSSGSVENEYCVLATHTG